MNDDSIEKQLIFDTERDRYLIAAYAESARLSADVVITFAIAHFLELKSIPPQDSHSHTESSSIL